MNEKKFEFINEASKKEFLELPKDVMSQFGSDLNAVQQSKKPFSDFKDISSSVGQGAIELIENGSPAYRTVYCAKYLDTVYILHSFTKTTQGVDRQAMKTAEKRYKLMMEKVREKMKQDKKDNKNKKKGGRKV
ncbi:MULTISPECIES: type II toxin-antitoxin system RelE/ParE family toxin [Gammaproteobacteria]|nr:type II toxin-antitoxin system RelE/ParE family toxin [Vibrio parahaemolyticus]MCQ9044514.1 type II toxin-antitoxin system RelE/ParE family toxin [Vibrio parahaemolyticus]HAS6726900.1 type II toxin-antitoxin system RelE/ParE family toxin [Vibrio parahaemolyticus]HAS6785167.1 type II toxin-antitoxin system RelE/ParE family toxin [Vibrio parahaemolyticus]HAS6793946.1 type II toxin-antitoxin system RelE/ParE family toxin [Vibrio parahaemolyticus]HAS6897986.1 type II toxin-antitoxin system RelE